MFVQFSQVTGHTIKIGMQTDSLLSVYSALLLRTSKQHSVMKECNVRIEKSYFLIIWKHKLSMFEFP